MSDNEPETEVGLFGEIRTDTEQVSTRQERLHRTLDTYAIAPAKVASSDWRMIVGTGLIAFFLLMGSVGVKIVPLPMINEAEPFLGAFVDWSTPFGTDQMGQPIGKQIVHATPAMLKMAAAGAFVSTGLAVLIGITAGYKGGKVDTSLMAMTDVVLTLPGLPLIILLAAIYEPRDPFIVGVILAIDSWPGLARSLRSQVLTIRNESYVEAGRIMGISSGTLLKRDVTPQLMPYILINAADAARRVIFESAGLYFLGVLPFTTLNWGVMMNMAHQSGGALANPGRAGHWLYLPMFAIIMFSFGLILFSQGMDRVFNPQLRAKHAKTVGDDDEMPK